MTPPRDAVLPAGIVLTVMGLVSAFLSDLPSMYAHSSGYSDGEGQGDLGAGKLYLSTVFQGAFLTLSVVLLAGALTCFAIVLIRRRRG